MTKSKSAGHDAQTTKRIIDKLHRSFGGCSVAVTLEVLTLDEPAMIGIIETAAAEYRGLCERGMATPTGDVIAFSFEDIPCLLEVDIPKSSLHAPPDAKRAIKISLMRI